MGWKEDKSSAKEVLSWVYACIEDGYRHIETAEAKIEPHPNLTLLKAHVKVLKKAMLRCQAVLDETLERFE